MHRRPQQAGQAVGSYRRLASPPKIASNQQNHCELRGCTHIGIHQSDRDPLEVPLSHKAGRVQVEQVEDDCKTEKKCRSQKHSKEQAGYTYIAASPPCGPKTRCMQLRETRPTLSSYFGRENENHLRKNIKQTRPTRSHSYQALETCAPIRPAPDFQLCFLAISA